jgi:hypothetical protein
MRPFPGMKNQAFGFDLSEFHDQRRDRNQIDIDWGTLWVCIGWERHLKCVIEFYCLIEKGGRRKKIWRCISNGKLKLIETAVRTKIVDIDID